MSLLHISFDGVTVTPMRSEKEKTFSDADVPSGSDSVYIKSAKIFQNSYKKNLTVGLPEFEQSEIDTKISAKKSAISAVAELSLPDAETLDQMEILIPTTDEKQSRIDSERGFTEEYAEDGMNEWNDANAENIRTLDQQKDVMRKRDDDKEIIADLTIQEASSVIEDERKQVLAEIQVKMIISNCLEVPAVSQSFKDQFTIIES